MRNLFVNTSVFTDGKKLANDVFDLKRPKYNQKEFSWIYSHSANEAVQNGSERLI